MDFYNYLRTQFNNLDEAKVFYKKWINEWGQDIPGHKEWSEINCFSMRAMAGHISAILTKNDNEYESDDCYTYADTKYGSEIYFSPYEVVSNG